MEPQKTREVEDDPVKEADAAEPQGRCVDIPVGGAVLAGELTVPPDAWGMVVIADGSPMVCRHPTHHRCVTKAFRRGGLATARVDLLTEHEQRAGAGTSTLATDIERLAERLAEANRWLAGQSEVRGLPAGYFGAGSGTAAALRVAAREPEAFGAIVVLGGRPDLVGPELSRVRTPTLLIAGAGDLLVIDWNRKALGELAGTKDLRVIPGASHLFEEAGAIREVAGMAQEWYRQNLAQVGEVQRH
jgi:pimeloyl-ACP methyl ester carboxylesterase